MVYSFQLTDVVPGLSFDVELEPNKQVYCFIGKNAVGKTKMLENLAKSMLYCHSIFHGYNKETSNFSLVFLNPVINVALQSKKLKLPEAITLNKQNIKTTEDNWTVAEFKQIPQEQPKIFSIDCPIIFINARGRGYISETKIEGIPLPNDIDGRFIDAFNQTFAAMNTEEVLGQDIIMWFLQRIGLNRNFVHGWENFINEVVVILELLQYLEPSQKLVIENGEDKEINVHYKEGKLFIGNVSISNLSTGFASIVRLFQGIIAGFGGWQANVADYKNIEGVVFIDEIEAHLHAEWQSKIIPLLKRFFPKTTFFIATHSPIIVASTERDEAYELVREDDDIVRAHKLGNPREWYLADVYEQAFHVNLDDLENDSKVNSAEPSLSDMLNQFSTFVKSYQREKLETIKADIEKLYELIISTIPENDPRRHSIDSLKGLVR
jgi:hypothetical protein